MTLYEKDGMLFWDKNDDFEVCQIDAYSVDLEEAILDSMQFEELKRIEKFIRVSDLVVDKSFIIEMTEQLSEMRVTDYLSTNINLGDKILMERVDQALLKLWEFMQYEYR